MMDDGRSLAVTLLMVNDVPANQEIFEPLARKRRDCDWWIHDTSHDTRNPSVSNHEEAAKKSPWKIECFLED